MLFKNVALIIRRLFGVSFDLLDRYHAGGNSAHLHRKTLQHITHAQVETLHQRVHDEKQPGRSRVEVELLKGMQELMLVDAHLSPFDNRKVPGEHFKSTVRALMQGHKSNADVKGAALFLRTVWHSLENFTFPVRVGDGKQIQMVIPKLVDMNLALADPTEPVEPVLLQH